MTGADHQDEPRPPADADSGDLPSAGLAGAGLPTDGLSWSRELDLAALIAAVSDPAPWSRGSDPPSSQPATSGQSPGPSGSASVGQPSADRAPADDADAELAEYLEAVEAGRSQVVPLTTVAGRIVESVPAGPDLAGWLAAGPATGLEDGALAGVAASYRRLASWAQAGELSAVAELASRSAAADDRIGVDGQGRPERLPAEACAEVSLALVMSQTAASWWADLGVTLRWRLAATGAALRAGTIDLGRARAIAEATALLDEQTARAVEARMLAGAGNKTMAGLRAALRRSVIAADPQGAERRREEAERQAKVVLYPDVEGTASLAGYNLPGIGAAAAMARISALAQALKASGAGGGIDLLRGHVFLGLLLGTLPYIPPPAGAPPDPDPPDHTPPGAQAPDGSSPDGSPPADGSPGDKPPGPGQRDRIGQADHWGNHRDNPSQADHRGNQHGHPDQRGGQGQRGDRDGRGRPGSENPGSGDYRDEPRAAGIDEDDAEARPPPAWPPVPPLLQPGPAAMDNLPPAGTGLLDLTLPWATLTGQSPEPGHLGRLGPITATQASYLADLATRDPAVRWRVIITDSAGRAIAVTRLTGQARSPGIPQTGLVRQVTVTIDQECLADPEQQTAWLPPILAQVLAAARSAVATAAHVPGGCDHAGSTEAYRPTRALWEHVTARDLTCRFLTCRQPATRCDLDHTVPYDQGGITCSCNLGAVCRCHHKIKQHPGWHLTQPTPGTFTWTTRTGRTYTTQPDAHAA